MAKLNLSNLANLQNENTAVSTINANMAALSSAIDNTVSRDGTVPNEMSSVLDMNSNAIINLPTPTTPLEPLRVTDANTLNGGGTITLSPLPVGGTKGMVLVKNTATASDASWKQRFVDVRDFGAPCNGVDDDSPGIQAAVDYLQANFFGGTVLLPPGLMAISTTVNLSARTSIIGAGDGATNIAVKNPTAHVFNLSGGNCTLAGFKFTTALKKTSGACIKIPSTGGGSYIRNIRTETGIPVAQSPSLWNVIEINSATNVSVRDCDFSNANNSGITVDGSTDIGTIDNVNIQWQGTLGSGGRCAMEVLNNGDLRVTNCQFEGTQNGVLLSAAAGKSVNFMDFYNCTCDHCQIGCNIVAAAGGGIVQTRFTNVQFTSSTNAGCSLDTSAGGSINTISFVNCTFQYNGSDGLFFSGTGTTNLRVIGCEFGKNTGSGSTVPSGVVHFSYIGNRFGNIGGADGNAVFGLSVGAACENFIVTNNDFTTNTGGTFNNAAGTSATKIFTNNIS